MNGGLPEMLRSLNAVDSGNSEMSVFERQRSRLSDYFNGNGVFPVLNGDQGLGEMLSGQTIKPDPGLENGWSGDYRRVLNYGNESEIEMGYGIPRTLSCPQNVAEETAVGKGKEAALSPTAAGKESSKKRKADKTQNLKAIPEEKCEEKKKRANGEEDSKMTEQNSSTTTASTNTNNNKNTKGPSANNKKDNSKASEVPKPDYIHVRARRGQATDSHSLAERVRREKISERMKYLQDLVPGCNKITGKAGMLDEIINYVQSLQRQVEFLSMKLAAVNPRLDFDIDSYLVKEVFSNIPTIGTSSDMVNNHAHLQFNALGQGILGSNNVEMVGNNPMDATLRRTTSAPVSIPQPFIDNQLTWEDELQNLYSMEYQQGRSHSLTGFVSRPVLSLAGLLVGHIPRFTTRLTKGPLVQVGGDLTPLPKEDQLHLFLSHIQVSLKAVM